MRNLRTLFLTGAIGAITVLAQARSAEACKCGGAPAFAVAQKRADAIFTGRVVAIDHTPDGKRSRHDELTVEVTRVYKGKVPRRIRLRSPATSCGLWMWGIRKPGGRYLFYTTRDEKGRLSARQCQRTAKLSRKRAQSDLVRLPDGYPPERSRHRRRR